MPQNQGNQRHTPQRLIAHLLTLGSPERAEKSLRFFKTGKGSYSEGDQFVGITVPVLRAEVKKHQPFSLSDYLTFIKHPVHEIRLFGLLALVDRYKRQKSDRNEIYKLYMAHTRFINNWDLVDLSCYFIVGPHLQDKNRAPLYQLARSSLLWDRRIAMVSTIHFIKQDQFDDTLRLARQLLHDPEDLLHKAVGWMLREVGKRDLAPLLAFLDEHSPQMPRTMLRYAIEKLEPPLYKAYLNRR